MTEDRRAWDPYAPGPVRAPEPDPLPESVEPPADATLPADLDDLRKPELIALAEEYGLDPSGTRADIIARLRATQS